VASPTRRFALPWEDSFLSLLMYIDPQGNVSADFLEGSISNFGVTGSKVASNGDDDRFITRMFSRRILVVRRDGAVFGHDVIPDGDGAVVQPPFTFAGSKVATNSEDRFVVGMFSRIIVIRRDGAVFGHDTTANNTILPPFAFAGSKVASNGDDDQFVVTMGTGNEITPGPQSCIVVVRRNGGLVGHTVQGRTISAGFEIRLRPPS
jgi:hypothetical protein